MQDKQNKRKAIWGILGGGILFLAVMVGESSRHPGQEEKYDLITYLGEQMTILACPLAGFLEAPETIVTWEEFFFSIPLYQSPLYSYLQESSETGELLWDYKMLALREGSDEAALDAVENPLLTEGGMTSFGTDREDDMDMTSGNVVAIGDALPLREVLPGNTGGFTINNFIPPENRSVYYSLEDLKDYSFLLRNFYIVDPGTDVTADQLNAEWMLTQDMTIDASADGPQILIYHTHSQEAFADSVPGDDSTTIVGAGEYLAEILEDQYGYEVLHHVASYDTREHNYAYSYAEPEIRRILEENPTIQVVIDLHRDEMAEGTRLVTQLNGQPTAQFMFFNGLSYLNELGHIDYLANPNLKSNLAFSFQMQFTANTYYPGLARRIYLKGYRYNMHLAERYLLIELGAQNNTVQEIRNACHPLADVIDRVLSGR